MFMRRTEVENGCCVFLRNLKSLDAQDTVNNAVIMPSAQNESLADTVNPKP